MAIWTSSPITAQFTAPFLAEFNGKAEDLTTGWHWSGAGTVRSLDLRTWGGGGALGEITGKLQVRGDAAGFTGTGPLTPAGLKAGVFDTVFEGSYADRVITASRIEVTHRSSRAHVDGVGTIGIVSNGPQLDLHGAWRDFRWPLVGAEAAMRSASGEYALSGIWPYDVRAAGSVAPTGLDPMQVEMEGQLAKDRVIFSAAGCRSVRRPGRAVGRSQLDIRRIAGR